MGAGCSKSGEKKYKSMTEKEVGRMKEKIRLLQEEVEGVMKEREKESKSYERDMVVYAFKEASWKNEKKKLKDEVKMLRKTVEEKDDIIREMEESGGGKGKGVSDKQWEWDALGTCFLMQQMKEERARRDEAVEKWKQLYLAIKIELDDLIRRTHNGDGLCWKGEDVREKIEKEMEAKEETIKGLKEEIVRMENDMCKKERDIDILKQSLRIMSNKQGFQVAATHREFHSNNMF